MEYCAPALMAYANPQDQSEQNIKTKMNKNKKTKKQNETHSRSQFVGLDLAQPPDRETDQVIHWSPSKI